MRGFEAFRDDYRQSFHDAINGKACALAWENIYTNRHTVAHGNRGQTAWSTTVDDRFFPGYPNPITVDPDGNVYVAGVTFAPNPSNPLNYQDFALCKFSSSGVLLWRVTYDPPDRTLAWVNGVGR